ncbi:bifunctional aminotransferase class I/II-fold pyridoxal phosphate-dependent enzyme/GNAT family N-acetyltransferase [Salegentibacter sp. JZCK2]|uniref:aminotransferase class I/II-fold pyridoxal phosphate-dependent enzyme n=1 Tax=Salegentibacter tibetensis TaxID=2873600 RepID=UPI001CCC760B|nr:aminotransferase class I/II-fold pyridoxal phosphate-dependent enzyme [Salegentibacter tibetensis]MBZ9730762.1 bifunctional aminotransferase class I/II-fold pyridoxal phosphate-dependent enzyme/GNAT family N-acetyltransferase [Salegentibacter tibetensis]
MAKIKHNNLLDTVVSVMTNAKEAGAIHLYAEGDNFDGRQIQIKGKKLFHFGTTGYLGLEQDERLKQGAIEAISAYGTEFPLSKSYISHPLYAELEALMTEIYGHPIVITKNSTLGHMGVIPSVVDDGDGVILDHQVHWSVQSAVNPLKLRSVPVEMIRHNNLEMLESKIKKLQSKCRKIWYMADGMYSMFGDYAPIEELMVLCKKYPQLHIYFDDVHGMSWKGKHGSGYVMSILKELPDRVILFGTMSKTFGASGAVLVCSDKKIQQRVKNFGGPLTFSVQLEPAAVGAAIASAKIHLSDEIYKMQEELADRISYFNHYLKQTNLPIIVENDSPVFYIGAGMPETGFNLVNRLIKNGYYVNIGFFPAVPAKNTGLRITISRHNQKEEIKGLVDSLVEEFPKALKETKTNLERVNFAFGRGSKNLSLAKQNQSSLSLEAYNSIVEIDPRLWNSTVGGHSFYDWNGLKSLENILKDQNSPEHNNQFYYYIIRDENQKCLLATFLSFGIWKEDMLAPKSVSVAIEKIRETKPYYHTSTCLSLGSMISEGDHLYLDQDSPRWKEAFNLLLEEIEKLEKRLQPQYLILRDFDAGNEAIKSFLQNKGYVQVAMPESAVYTEFNWGCKKEYVNTLSKRSRKHFRNDIEAFKDKLEIKIRDNLSQSELERSFKLYMAVKDNNLGLNTFTYPFSLFQHMNSSSQWEFILIYLYDKHRTLAGVMFCYKNSEKIYTPAVVGMDYEFSREYNIYRQLLYQTILRAQQLGFIRIDFGLTAGFEKRKVGAKIIDKCAYIQTRDNFALEALDWLRKD